MASLAPALHIAIDSEARMSVGFIQHGVDALADLDGANNFAQLPMQLLSIGLERFLKLTIALAELEQLGALPNHKTIRGFGHDLQRLPPHLVQLAQRSSVYTARPACAKDLSFLESDQLLAVILHALSTYAKQGRYHHLETILGQADPPNPDHEWSAIVNQSLEALPHWKGRIGQPSFAGFYDEMSAQLTAIIQRCARAVSRMWTLGPLGQLGSRYSGILQPFLALMDHALPVPSHRRL